MLQTPGKIRQLSLIVLMALGMLLPLTAQAETHPLKSVRGITFKQVQVVASEPKSLPALENALRQASPDYASRVSRNPIYAATYFYSLIDLNGDGKPEAIVYPLGPYFCGSGGCTLMIFQTTTQGYRLIGRIPVSRSPIVVTDTKSNGWKVLIRPTAGGGLPLNYTYLHYSQGQYAESGDVPNNTAVLGKAVLADEMSVGKGLKLKVK